MKKLDDFLRKLDASFPKHWIIDGVEQTNPIKQFGFIIGVIITIIILLIIN